VLVVDIEECGIRCVGVIDVDDAHEHTASVVHDHRPHESACRDPGRRCRE
jgi:hypothetical protein